MAVLAIGSEANGNSSAISSATSAAYCWVLSFWSPALSWRSAGAARNKADPPCTRNNFLNTKGHKEHLRECVYKIFFFAANHANCHELIKKSACIREIRGRDLFSYVA